jgi:hypothetical protein
MNLSPERIDNILLPQEKGSLEAMLFFFYLCDGTLGTAATTGLFYQPRMIGDGNCGEIWWNEDWQGKPKYSEETCPVPLCPPQIPYD